MVSPPPRVLPGATPVLGPCGCLWGQRAAPLAPPVSLRRGALGILGVQQAWPPPASGRGSGCCSPGLLTTVSSLSVPGLGYDPYNPELPKPPTQRENGVLGRGGEPRSDILELELVNQAIEAVRSEVEMEQRRYQELLETAREHISAEVPALAPHGPAAGLDEDTFPLSFEYSPGGCDLLSPDAGYQPTPLAAPAEAGSKYSLAALDRAQGHGSGGSSALEYVPKAVSQPRRYSRPVSSGKYVVDDSKPSTDLEYDPLSNFSARLLGGASSRDGRAPKRPRGSRGSSEPYMPALKKPCDPFGGCDARFSDSDDDDAAAAGRRPVTASPPRARAGAESKGTRKPGSREGQEPEDGGLRETKEMAVQYDVGDLGQPPKGLGGTSLARPEFPAIISQEHSGPKEGRPKKKSGVLSAPSPRDSGRKTDRGEDREHGKLAGKPCASKRGPQAGSHQHKGERPQGTKKKPSLATSVASSGKGRPERPGLQPSPTCGDAPQLPDRTGGKAPPGKLAERKACSLDEGASQAVPKLPRRALSHVDLFGDESEDEEPGPRAPGPQPPALPSLSSSSDSDSDSSLGLVAARGPHKRLKATPSPSPGQASPSSSPSSSGAGTDVDYAALEKEVDFDSDPMEECLRIFNESTCVKTEDRGRLAQQVSVRGAGSPPEFPCDWPPSAKTEMALTSSKIQEPSVAACCPPAPCPERGRWLLARPVGFRPTGAPVQHLRAAGWGTGYPRGPAPPCLMSLPLPQPLPLFTTLCFLYLWLSFLAPFPVSFPFSFTLCFFRLFLALPFLLRLSSQTCVHPTLYLLVVCPHIGHQRELALNRTGRAPPQNLRHLRRLCRGHRVRPALRPGRGGAAVRAHPLIPPRVCLSPAWGRRAGGQAGGWSGGLARVCRSHACEAWKVGSGFSWPGRRWGPTTPPGVSGHPPHPLRPGVR